MATQKFNSFFDEFSFGENFDKATQKGECFVDVLDKNPGYIAWCLDNDVIEISKPMEQRVENKVDAWRAGRPTGKK